MNKPYSSSCDQNREPILAVIEPLLRDCETLLEIGSGTGQHAVYFGARMPRLSWQTSDREANLDGIRQWLDEVALPNLPPPLRLDVVQDDWPAGPFDAVFSANTLHIMHWSQVEASFAGVGRVLRPGGRFLLYGPFNYGGRYTAVSNERFDHWLRQQDPRQGVRNFEDLDTLAEQAGMRLLIDHTMPADNHLLIWTRKE